MGNPHPAPGLDHRQAGRADAAALVCSGLPPAGTSFGPAMNPTAPYGGPARLVLSLFLVPALAGCPSAGEPEGAAGPPDTTATPLSTPGPGQVHERDVAFVATEADSTLLVPWIFTARTHPGAVEREARGWLDRNGSWDPFFRERWRTAPTRTPWRVIPRGPFRLVVGSDDVLRRVIYEEGTRRLEVRLGPLVAEWSGPRGERFQVRDGSAVLSGEELAGMVYEARLVRRAQDRPHGDWAFLTSGDSVQIVLYDPSPEQQPAEMTYRGLARIEGAPEDRRERRWAVVGVDWTVMRAFQEARRDIPVEWTLGSPDGDLEGRLRAVTSELTAGEGDGPLLPVEALFQVRGTVEIGGREFPVRGLFRHLQG